jgi:quercetin dioxygenase-like cupin family protein
MSEETAVSGVFSLPELAQYGDDAIVSRTLMKRPTGTVTLFAFDQGQELSEHTAPFDAIAQVLDGQGEFIIGGVPHLINAGQTIIMPANIPHAVKAVARFKMLLTMIRS